MNKTTYQQAKELQDKIEATNFMLDMLDDCSSDIRSNFNLRMGFPDERYIEDPEELEDLYRVIFKYYKREFDKAKMAFNDL